jgi:hypothetical protein
MNKKISIGIIVIILVLCLIIFAIYYNKIKANNISNDENTIINNEETNKENEIYITNGKITNEKLIDEFIENIEQRQDTELIINEDENKIILEYFIGDNDKKYNEYYENNPQSDDSFSIDQETVDTLNLSDEEVASEYKRIYGYYAITVNDEETETYDAFNWQIKRKTTDNVVELYFYTYGEIAEFPEICHYDLDSAEYVKEFELTYTQRKDLGVYKIAEKDEFDNEDYGIYTFGGNVSITIEDDMVYNLKDALEQNIITAQDIINQANLDYKYGICDMEYYSDGGSTEYLYDEYTILKYNTLDNQKDLVIGMKGEIINQLNKN